MLFNIKCNSSKRLKVGAWGPGLFISSARHCRELISLKASSKIETFGVAEMNLNNS